MLEPGLARLNGLAAEEAADDLLACCGAPAWARRMAASRPFADPAALFAAAERIWWALLPTDWWQAFAAHPRIGESATTGPAGRDAEWSTEEQSAARSVPSSALTDLAEANREYEARFGHVFLISASGKSAQEILAALHRRMGNDPGTELSVAAGEQAKITRLRLEKLLR